MLYVHPLTAAAAKLLQSCPTLCDPIGELYSYFSPGSVGTILQSGRGSL